MMRSDDAQIDAMPSQSRRRAIKLGSSLGLLGVAMPFAVETIAAQVGGRVPASREHIVESNERTVRVGVVDPKAEAVVTIESGDVVRYVNTWINWGNEAKYGMSFAEREPIRRKYPQGPYSLVGPVAIKGAHPGDLIECRMIKLRPIQWGWNAAPRGVGALPKDFDKPYLKYFRFDNDRRYANFAPGIRIPLKPIQGFMATAPASDETKSAILAGPNGGNIALSELVAGTSLFLPVSRDGAMVWTGNSHAAQGDGQVDQTTIETAMEDLQIQYILHKGASLPGPMAETPTHWIGLGFGETIADALKSGLREQIKWLAATAGISDVEAYSIYSMAGSFRITQYADQVASAYSVIPAKAVHGMLPKAVFTPEMRNQIAARTRAGGLAGNV
ncbi:acetamidase/formamidase family protein [Paraburkholderia solitsugae]|nr:acetamidase/formamidase family protein [Paraburkholderia solitsugae]